jgi:hypothetical protein
LCRSGDRLSPEIPWFVTKVAAAWNPHAAPRASTVLA